MRYIEQEDRERARTEPRTAAELNHAITKLVLGFLGDAPRATRISTTPLEPSKAPSLELYRRVVAPYEDRKIAENGTTTRCQKELTAPHHQQAVHSSD